jgi:hypothetical protein
MLDRKEQGAWHLVQMHVTRHMDNTKRHSSLGIENDVIMGPPISVPFYICDRGSRGRAECIWQKGEIWGHT